MKDELSEVKATLAEEKALNAKRHEDLLSAITTLTAQLSSPPSWTYFCPMFPALFYFLFLLLFSCFQQLFFHYLVVPFDWQRFILTLGWLLVNTVPCLSSCCYLFVHESDDQYHYYTTYLSVSLVVFLHYPSGGDCKQPASLCLIWPPFFDDVKRGKMGMTMVF